MSEYLNVFVAKFSLFFSQVHGHWVDFLLLCVCFLAAVFPQLKYSLSYYMIHYTFSTL